MNKNTLPRNKSLKSTKLIDTLFEKGKTIIVYPLRLVYIYTDEIVEQDFQVSFTVSKKKFKNAVDRNYIKRLMRESFRKQQHQIKPKNIAMMWIFMDKNKPDYEAIHKSVEKIIEKLNKKNNGTT
jgi:ribonuclease P protein component